MRSLAQFSCGLADPQQTACVWNLLQVCLKLPMLRHQQHTRADCIGAEIGLGPLDSSQNRKEFVNQEPKAYRQTDQAPEILRAVHDLGWVPDASLPGRWARHAKL